MSRNLLSFLSSYIYIYDRMICICFLLTPSTPDVANCCCSKRSGSHQSNLPFLIFDIRALWRSVLSARAREYQKLKMVGQTSMAKCKALTGSVVKWLSFPTGTIQAAEPAATIQPYTQLKRSRLIQCRTKLSPSSTRFTISSRWGGGQKVRLETMPLLLASLASAISAADYHRRLASTNQTIAYCLLSNMVTTQCEVAATSEMVSATDALTGCMHTNTYKQRLRLRQWRRIRHVIYHHAFNPAFSCHTDKMID